MIVFILSDVSIIFFEFFSFSSSPKCTYFVYLIYRFVRFRLMNLSGYLAGPTQSCNFWKCCVFPLSVLNNSNGFLSWSICLFNGNQNRCCSWFYTTHGAVGEVISSINDYLGLSMTTLYRVKHQAQFSWLVIMCLKLSKFFSKNRLQPSILPPVFEMDISDSIYPDLLQQSPIIHWLKN